MLFAQTVLKRVSSHLLKIKVRRLEQDDCWALLFTLSSSIHWNWPHSLAGRHNITQIGHNGQLNPWKLVANIGPCSTTTFLPLSSPELMRNSFVKLAHWHNITQVEQLDLWKFARNIANKDVSWDVIMLWQVALGCVALTQHWFTLVELILHAIVSNPVWLLFCCNTVQCAWHWAYWKRQQVELWCYQSRVGEELHVYMCVHQRAHIA